MNEKTTQYFSVLPRNTGALPVLSALAAELSEQISGPQLRSLWYLAGGRLAAQFPAEKTRTMGEFSEFVQDVLRTLDLGWSASEEVDGAIDFVHGCAPLEQWFGKGSLPWATGLLEGMYAEWMRQLGAGEDLDVREVIDERRPGGDTIRFRLAHETVFAGAAS